MEKGESWLRKWKEGNSTIHLRECFQRQFAVFVHDEMCVQRMVAFPGSKGRIRWLVMWCSE